MRSFSVKKQDICHYKVLHFLLSCKLNCQKLAVWLAVFPPGIINLFLLISWVQMLELALCITPSAKYVVPLLLFWRIMSVLCYGGGGLSSQITLYRPRHTTRQRLCLSWRWENSFYVEPLTDRTEMLLHSSSSHHWDCDGLVDDEAHVHQPLGSV